MIPVSSARESAIITALTADYEDALIEFMSEYDLSFDRFLKVWKARQMSQLHLVGQDRIEYGAYLQMAYYLLLERFLLTDLAAKKDLKRLATIHFPEYRVLICSIVTIYALYTTFMTRISSRLLPATNYAIRVTEKRLEDINTVLTVAENCQLGKVAEDIRSFMNYLISSQSLIVTEYSGPVSLYFLQKHHTIEAIITNTTSEKKKRSAVTTSTIRWRDNSATWQHSIEGLSYDKCTRLLTAVYTFSGDNPLLQQLTTEATTITEEEDEPTSNFKMIAERIKQIKNMIQQRRQEIVRRKVEREQAIANKAAAKQKLAEDRLRKKVFNPKPKRRKRSFLEFTQTDSQHQQQQQQRHAIEESDDSDDDPIPAINIEHQHEQQQQEIEALPSMDIEAALTGDVSGFWQDFREFVGMGNSSSTFRSTAPAATVHAISVTTANVASMDDQEEEEDNDENEVEDEKHTSMPGAVSSHDKGKVGSLLDELEAQIKAVMERENNEEDEIEDDDDEAALEMEVDSQPATSTTTRIAAQAQQGSSSNFERGVDVQQLLAELEGSSNLILSQQPAPLPSRSSTVVTAGPKKNVVAASRRPAASPASAGVAQQQSKQPSQRQAVTTIRQQQHGGIQSIEAILKELENATNSILPGR